MFSSLMEAALQFYKPSGQQQQYQAERQTECCPTCHRHGHEHGCGSRTPHGQLRNLHLNWAGGDVYGRDLLDLDEADSELFQRVDDGGSSSSNDVFSDLRSDNSNDNGKKLISNNKLNPGQETPRQNFCCSAGAEEGGGSGLPITTLRCLQGQSSAGSESPQYPPTLLELEVQALAKVGILKLFHDQDVRVPENERNRRITLEREKVERIQELDRQREEALPPSKAETSQFYMTASRSDEFLELERAARKSMEARGEACPEKGGVLNIGGRLCVGGEDLLQLHNFQNQPTLSKGKDLDIMRSNLLELQKMALLGMKNNPLSDVFQPQIPPTTTATSASAPTITWKHDPSNDSEIVSKPEKLSEKRNLRASSSSALLPHSHVIEGGLLQLQRMALATMRGKQKKPQAQGGDTLPSCSDAMAASAPADVTVANSYDKIVFSSKKDYESRKVENDGLLELQKVALKRVQNEPFSLVLPTQPPSHIKQDSGESSSQQMDTTATSLPKTEALREPQKKDLLELQKVALKNMKESNIMAPNDQANLPFNDRKQVPENLQTSCGQERLDLSGGNVAELDHQKEPLGMYDGELTDTLHLLESMNSRCVNANQEMEKVVTEVQQIYSSLNESYAATIENLATLPECCASVQCGKGIHKLFPQNFVSTDPAFQTQREPPRTEDHENEAPRLGSEEQQKLADELLLIGLHNIESTRLEAEQSFSQQIERNKQLIQELEALDALDTPPQLSHPADNDTHDYGMKDSEPDRQNILSHDVPSLGENLTQAHNQIPWGYCQDFSRDCFPTSSCPPSCKYSRKRDLVTPLGDEASCARRTPSCTHSHSCKDLYGQDLKSFPASCPNHSFKDLSGQNLRNLIPSCSNSNQSYKEFFGQHLRKMSTSCPNHSHEEPCGQNLRNLSGSCSNQDFQPTCSQLPHKTCSRGGFEFRQPSCFPMAFGSGSSRGRLRTRWCHARKDLDTGHWTRAPDEFIHHHHHHHLGNVHVDAQQGHAEGSDQQSHPDQQSGSPDEFIHHHHETVGFSQVALHQGHDQDALEGPIPNPEPDQQTQASPDGNLELELEASHSEEVQSDQSHGQESETMNDDSFSGSDSDLAVPSTTINSSNAIDLQVTDAITQVESKVLAELHILEGDQQGAAADTREAPPDCSASEMTTEHIVQNDFPSNRDINNHVATLEDLHWNEITALQNELQCKDREIVELCYYVGELERTLCQEKDFKSGEQLHHGNDNKITVHRWTQTQCNFEQNCKGLQKLHDHVRNLSDHVHSLRESLLEERNRNNELGAKQNRLENDITLLVAELGLKANETEGLHAKIHAMEEELNVPKKNASNGMSDSFPKNNDDESISSGSFRAFKAKDLQEIISKKEEVWKAERQQLVKQLNESETTLLVKEEEIIQLTHNLPMGKHGNEPHINFLMNYSKQASFHPQKAYNHDPSHFFHTSMHMTSNGTGNGKQESREVLDLRCEVLSLQDRLEMKNQVLKATEVDLTKAQKIVMELRNKMNERQREDKSFHAHKPSNGQNSTTMASKRMGGPMGGTTREKRLQSERQSMMRQIDELTKRCKHLEELERKHQGGLYDMREQTIRELEWELERNVQIIKKMKSRCTEYEAKIKQSEAKNNEAILASQEKNATFMVQMNASKKELEDECQRLRREVEKFSEQIKEKDKLLIELQTDMQSQKKRQSPSSPSRHFYDDNEAAGDFSKSKAIVPGDKLESKGNFDDRRMKKPKTNDALPVQDSDIRKVKAQVLETNTLRELLRGQWKLQKIMEERLNSMMAYVNDRVEEFENVSPSEEASDSSSIACTSELNHFHVEAKLMKVQLEQQLQVLRGTQFTSAQLEEMHQQQQQQQQEGIDQDAEGVGSDPESDLSSQSLQLLVEKMALEDSAQTLQQKTSRLLNKLTTMRSELCDASNSTLQGSETSRS